MTTKKAKYEIEPAHEQTQIITAATRETTPAIWRMIGEMAPVMYQAHLFGVNSPAQAAAIMLKGYELGLSTTAAFEFIQVIQGKPALSPRGAMALLHSSNLVKVEIKRIADDKGFIGYECKMLRGEFEHTSRFTMKDAQAAGLVKPDSGWAKYPENMCMWRAVGFAADVVAPDITAGMTTLMKAPEMYGVALTEGGDVIEAQAVTMPDYNQEMQTLLTEYGAEKIIEAFGGIPANVDEIARAREMLKSA